MEKLLTMVRKKYPHSYHHAEWSSKLAPDGNFPQDFGGLPESTSQQEAGPSVGSATSLFGLHGIKALAIDDDDSPTAGSDLEEDFSTRTLVKGGTEFAAMDLRYFGKSSGVRFVQTALELKQQYHGGEEVSKASFLSTRRIEFWEPQPVSPFLYTS